MNVKQYSIIKEKIKSVLNSIDSYLEDENQKENFLNGETLTFTIQIKKSLQEISKQVFQKYFRFRNLFRNLNLIFILSVGHNALIQQTMLMIQLLKVIKDCLANVRYVLERYFDS